MPLHKSSNSSDNFLKYDLLTPGPFQMNSSGAYLEQSVLRKQPVRRNADSSFDLLKLSAQYRVVAIHVPSLVKFRCGGSARPGTIS